jgi:hypothetical protein
MIKPFGQSTSPALAQPQPDFIDVASDARDRGQAQRVGSSPPHAAAATAFGGPAPAPWPRYCARFL